MKKKSTCISSRKISFAYQLMSNAQSGKSIHFNHEIFIACTLLRVHIRQKSLSSNTLNRKLLKSSEISVLS